MSSAPPRRRLLVVLDHPGALLHFDETIRELAVRGHELYLAFLRPSKYAEALDVLGDAADRITLSLDPPIRRDRFSAAAAWTRSLTDYVHYLDPALAEARYSRRKWLDLTQLPRWLRRRLAGRDSASAETVRHVLGLLGRLEAAIPPSREIEDYLRGIAPEAVIVSPLVDHQGHQTDYLKAAAALGVPSALLVTSWDNLTSKGRIRVVPDSVIVWNETQRLEAITYHGVDPDRIVLTGAQQFDRWFDRTPSTTRDELLKRFDLPPGKPFVLFTCSTRQGLPSEAEPDYARRWLTALRVSQDPAVHDVSVLIRPHPTAVERWRRVDLTGLGSVAIWMRDRPLPIGVDDRAEYFDALYHCSALVAINSTSMIEAAIVNRPVHTIAIPEFALMQHDLLHFHYLLLPQGGFLCEASSFEEHARLLAEDLRDPAAGQAARRRFIESFIRPLGADSATFRLVDEMVAVSGVAAALPARPDVAGRVLLALLMSVLASRTAAHRATDGVVAGLSDGAGRRLDRSADAIANGHLPALAPALTQLGAIARATGQGSRRRMKRRRAQAQRTDGAP